jgi:hypothetical protein
MMSLREKHEYEEQIEQLNIDLIASMIECKKLTQRNKLLQKKVATNVFAGEDLAVSLINERINGLKITLQEISNRSGLSYNNVRVISSQLKIKHERGTK